MVYFGQSHISAYNRNMTTKNIIIALLALLLIGGGSYLLLNSGNTIETLPTDMMPVEPEGGIGDGAQPLDELISEDDSETTLTYESQTVLGSSVNGSAITAYHFGNGTNEMILIGGAHGSYSANTSALANEFISYLGANESLVPADMRVTVIPTVNPDGLAAGGTTGRFNANNVDINRNFGCDWAPTSMWRDQEVSGGSAAFSEPEAQAIRDYVSEINAVGAIVWFAAEGKVYPSACAGTPSNASVTLAATFANAAGYGVEAEFDAYTINGDMVNWLAKEGVPAISVLLTDRNGIEWDKNEAGFKAALSSLSN
jgi:murein tripeptide amidase MpaA